MTRTKYPQLHDEAWVWDQIVAQKRPICQIAEEVGSSVWAVYDASHRFGIKSPTGKGGFKHGLGSVAHARMCGGQRRDISHYQKHNLCYLEKARRLMAGEVIDPNCGGTL